MAAAGLDLGGSGGVVATTLAPVFCDDSVSMINAALGWRWPSGREWNEPQAPERCGQSEGPRPPGAELHVVRVGPHGINAAHAEEFNRVLIDFLAL